MQNTFWTPHGHTLKLPLIGAPMFLVSGPALVIAQCRAGIVGTLPALGARSIKILDGWLGEITTALAASDQAGPVAPFGVNLIVHSSNTVLPEHVDLCVKYKVPLVITSLGSRPEVNTAIQAYGGIVLHDVTNTEHGRKALDRGANGLIAVAAGAGGHAGAMSPIALIENLRSFWDGPLVLSGAISTGRGILAAQSLGADMGYCGTLFIAATESLAAESYRDMVIAAESKDIVYTDRVSGTNANFLRGSLIANGIMTDGALLEKKPDMMNEAKAWRDVWSAGHGVGQIRERHSVAEIVDRLHREYRAALARIAALA
ncbi:MAG: NAD(P)H-dependent flavin oxidoreductase [Cypionkella sp.]